MTPMLSILKSSGRAAIVALTLGAATLTAMPAAQAQTPSFSFNFGLNGAGDPSLSFGVDSGRKGDRNFKRACLGDRQIIRGLRDAGFRDVQLGDDLSRSRVEAFGRYRGVWYSMRVNRCTGEVDRIQRLRRSNGGGFGLQFNF